MVKGSKKARRDGAAAQGLVYKIEIPMFSQGMVNAKAEVLEELMEISAM